MRLPAEFLQLPLLFDFARLAHEVAAMPASAWLPHPQGFANNDALILVSVDGAQDSNSFAGSMQPTPALQQSPYMQQVLASLQTVIGRSRLMRIGGGAEAKPHYDLNYYWQQRLRIHIPIQTNDQVQFHCGDKQIHMRSGECWVFDTWKIHRVSNPEPTPRIHLVCDTVGSGRFWDLLAQSRNPFAVNDKFAPQLIKWQTGQRPQLHFETCNIPSVMTPWEQESLLAALINDLQNAEPPAETFRQFQAQLERFRFQWRGLWARYGDQDSGHPFYRQALKLLQRQMQDMLGQMLLPNGADPAEVVLKVIVDLGLSASGEHAQAAMSGKQTQTALPAVATLATSTPRLRRPVLIAAAPRSGSTLLFEALAGSADLVHIGGESHGLIERIPGLHPAARDYHSNALSASDADRQRIKALRDAFLSAIQARYSPQQMAQLGPDLQLLEKTPKNALRLNFLLQAFPAAHIVYLLREPRENIASIIDAWQSGRFVTYPDLPDWQGLPWSLLLIPGWRDLPADDVAMIAARQWQTAHEAILDSITKLPPQRVHVLRYEDLRAQPHAVIAGLCEQLQISAPQLAQQLPLSRHTLTPPDPNKWQRHSAALQRVLPVVEDTRQRIDDWLRQQQGQLTHGMATPTPAA